MTSNSLREHQEVISRWGSCWWGWFASENEDVCVIQTELQVLMDTGKRFTVALWDRTNAELAIGVCRRLELAPVGGVIQAPKAERVPSDAEHPAGNWPAWFEFIAITPIEQDDFIEEYGIQLDVTATRTVLWPANHATQDFAPFCHTSDRSSFLHLSDLHFGRPHRWSTPRFPREGLTTFQALIKSMEFNGVTASQVGGVVVSGDISSLGPNQDAFADARDFLTELLDWLELPPNALVIVPGNHDIARLSKDESIDDEDPQVRAEHERTRAGEKLYRDFLERVYGMKVPMVRWHQIDLLGGQMRLNFIALNSTRLVSYDDHEYGYTGKAHHALLGPIAEDRKRRAAEGLSTMGCAVLHHHLISAYSEKLPKRIIGSDHQDPVSSTLDSARLLREFTDHQIQLVLHGHQHVPSWSKISKGIAQLDQHQDWVIDIHGGGSLGAHGDWLHPDYNYNYWGLYSFDETSFTQKTVPLNDTPARRAPVRRRVQMVM